jgi:hypothetical protein
MARYTISWAEAEAEAADAGVGVAEAALGLGASPCSRREFLSSCDRRKTVLFLNIVLPLPHRPLVVRESRTALGELRFLLLQCTQPV